MGRTSAVPRRGTVVTITAVLAALGLAPAPGALGATIVVTTNADTTANDAQCSIREAIAAANTDTATGGCPAGDAGADTVALGTATYNLDSGGGELVISDDLTVSGAGAAATTVTQGVGPARVIEITAGGAPAVTFMGLTISNGFPSGGEPGSDAFGVDGGFGQDGQSVVGGTGQPGSSGGGILNNSSGALVLNGVTMSSNQAADGGAGGAAAAGDGGGTGVGGAGTGGPGGAGGSGGAIYTVGPLTVIDSTFSMNSVGDGGAGGNATGGHGGTGSPGRVGGTATGGSGGAAGSGGAIAAESTVTINRSVFTQNEAENGGAGGTGHGGDGGVGSASTSFGGSAGGGNGGNGGPAGKGGAIHLVSGSASLTITDSSFMGNRTDNAGAGGSGTGGIGGQSFGAGAVAGFGGGGNGGDGGVGGDGLAINWPGTVTILRSLVANSQGNLFGGKGGAGQGGSAGFPSTGSSGQAGGAATGGDGGRGPRGAILVGPSSSVTNSTFTFNTPDLSGSGGNATGGNGSGAAASGAATAGNGANGGAGAVHALGALSLTHVTIAYLNLGSSGGSGGQAFGNGTKINGSAGSVGPGAIRSDTNTTLTASIVSGNGTPECTGTISDGGHNIAAVANGCPGTAGDPKLGALADNGGPTQTMALQAGSAALDVVPTTGAGCESVDQRGVTRPHGTACDAGAYERAGPDATTGDAADITASGATLPGSVTPNGHATTYHFEYGTTTAYGTSTADQDAGSGVAAGSVSTAATGLAPATTYHFRLVASSSEGTASGADHTFTTAVAPTDATGGQGTGPGTGPGAGAVTADTTAPLFLSASIKPPKFPVKRGKRGGALFRYALSEDAGVVFTIARVMLGRKVGTRCVKPSRSNARKRPCKRYVQAGRFTAKGRKGANTKTFTGRIGRRVLKPGAYRATLTAKDAAGNRSRPRRLTFRIIR
jgi:CSLREA domain-containing protein